MMRFLANFSARFNEALKMFRGRVLVSSKPAVEKLFGFSRYAYANNSPVDTMDPDGREARCVLMTGHCGQFAAGQPDIQKNAGQLGQVVKAVDENIAIPMIGAQPLVMKKCQQLWKGWRPDWQRSRG